MPIEKSKICNFGWKASNFELKSTNGKITSIGELKGPKGTLIMFICNHCPYVKSIIGRLVNETNELKNLGVYSIGIMSNDVKEYPEDSFDNMINFSNKNNFQFPYLFDEDQKVAKNYDAKCTPDFFGFNKNLELQYRGRLDSLKYNEEILNKNDLKRELYNAMKEISISGIGPENQIPSVGCSIKWKNQ